MRQLFTIGHSTLPAEQFVRLLKQYDIDYVLDVRSTAFSKYASQYNSDVLPHILGEAGIRYAGMGKYFGARQAQKEYYTEEGHLDFEKFRDSELFRMGLANVQKGLKDYNIALMCTEKDPYDCHRAIMVSRGFELAGIDVNHILSDGSLLKQADLNERLLEQYFPERDQISLFENENKDEQQCLEEAYRKRNAEIGYHMTEM